MSKIEIGMKNYTMRNGSEVRIFMTDNGGPFPVLGAYKGQDGEWRSAAWSNSGKWGTVTDPHDFDLIEVKPVIEKTVWIILMDNGSLGVCWSRPEQASNNLGAIAQTKVTLRFEEGRFDD